MIRASFKYLVIGLVVVLALTMVAPQQATARHWGCCGWGWGGWGWGWGGCGWGYSCYYPCYSSCWGCRRACCGWSTCDYGCSYGCCDLGCGCLTGTVTYPAAPALSPTPASKEPTPAAPSPVPPAAPSTEPAPTTPVPPPSYTPKTSATPADQSGAITVWVPYDAKVTVNGHATKSTGTRRQFISYGLKPGLNYKYVIAAQVVRDGKVVEDSQTVVLTAGQVTAVAFGFNAAASEQVASTR